MKIYLMIQEFCSQRKDASNMIVTYEVTQKPKLIKLIFYKFLNISEFTISS